jgi:peptidoglycan-associated lipoprotein
MLDATGAPCLSRVVMREQVLILTMAALAGYGAEAPPYCPAWPEDCHVLQEQTVYFQTGAATLNDEANRKANEVAKHLKANPTTAVRIEGHCDDRGTAEHNYWLGERRAQALRKKLIRLGVDPNRVDTISFGKDRPVNPGHNWQARKENRRAEFVLLSPPIPEADTAGSSEREAAV